jgi:hypothetical protein
MDPLKIFITIKTPKDARSGIAPKNKASHGIPRYPNKPLPHNAWLSVSI